VQNWSGFKYVFHLLRIAQFREIIAALDELKQFASKFYRPPELNKIARMGRAENLELLTSTQFPRDYHADIRGNVTEWVCFSSTEPAEIEAVRPYFPGVDRVAQLPKGQFIAFNRNSGAELSGRVF
jgi:DNA helicase HerA-like ATPase